jgi:polysaccharide biosynthesis transport protein
VPQTGLNQGQLAANSIKNTVDIKQLFQILFRRQLLVFGVSCTVMSVAALYYLTAKSTYQSSMQMLVSSNLDERMPSSNIQSGDSQVVDYTPQLKLMLSSKLIEKAVDILRHEYPGITVEDIQGNIKQTPLIVTQFQGGTAANKVKSQVFEVSFKADDPIKSKKVLQVLQQIYQDYNTDQEKQHLSKGLAFISDRLPKIQEGLIQAERKLEQFQKRNNLLDPEIQGKILLESLADVKRQLQATRAQLQDALGRYNSLQEKLSSTRPAPSKSNQELLNAIRNTELALAQERQRYTDDAPSVQQLIQQRQSQAILLQQELASLNSTDVQPQPSSFDPMQMQLGELRLAVKGLTDSEKSLASSESQLRVELSRYPSLIAEYNRLRRDVETNRKILEQMQQTQRDEGMKIVHSGFDWQVLEQPRLEPYTNKYNLLSLLGGVAIAPFLGVAAALFREMFNDAIYTPEELQKLTGLNLLGTVPKLQCNHKKRLLMPFSARNEANTKVDAIASLDSNETLDMVYQSLQIFKFPLAFKSLMVTSALPGEGKSTLALGLAVSAARMHQRVLLIDGNLRNPSLHNTLELSNEWGLSLLLVDDVGSTSFGDYIQPIHPAIDVLTAGENADDPAKLLSSGRMKELLLTFEETYDLVLIDAPPILGLVDGRILASLCNAIALVGRMGKVTRGELIQTTNILSKLNLIGAIANDVRIS